MSIVATGIVKEFNEPKTRVLHGIDLKITEGEFVSISGRSGSGKSTLLYILSTLDMPTSGEVKIGGQSVNQMKVNDLHYFRSNNIGFVFQFHHLLPELTALENVLLAPRNLNLVDQKKAYALELLNEFGIGDKLNKFPSQLSGGEQQRVAIARALIMSPRYVFADEPTGNLDLKNGLIVMNLLKRINEQHRTTVVMVTHEPDFAAMADREIYLVDGRVSAR